VIAECLNLAYQQVIIILAQPTQRHMPWCHLSRATSVVTVILPILLCCLIEIMQVGPLKCRQVFVLCSDVAFAAV
jgi:hypothetical protein